MKVIREGAMSSDWPVSKGAVHALFSDTFGRIWCTFLLVVATSHLLCHTSIALLLNLVFMAFSAILTCTSISCESAPAFSRQSAASFHANMRLHPLLHLSASSLTEDIPSDPYVFGFNNAMRDDLLTS